MFVCLFVCFFLTFALGNFSYQFIILEQPFQGHLYQISPLVNIVPHEIGVGSDLVHGRRRGGLVCSVLPDQMVCL